MATVRRESLSAASNVPFIYSFIYLANVYSALRPVTLLGLREISDDQRVLLSIHRVYGLEVETSIDEILSEIIALKEREKDSSCGRVFCNNGTNLEGQGELL